MTQKRKDVMSTSNDLVHSKRPRPSYFDGGEDKHNTPIAAQPRLDPTYGQRGAFPGIDDWTSENTLFYGPASDGLEYLQMVRTEARGVPNLLVAPLSPTVVKAEVHADYEQGYYADGAYTALPDTTSSRTGVLEDDDADPQEAYYASLCSRFAALRSTLRSAPPLGSARTKTATEEASTFIPLSPAKWRRHFFNMKPTMLFLRQLRQEDVVQGLEILESLLTTANLQRRGRIGAWAWGLLARCREIGEMGSEEVGVLRDLGKKAIGVIRAIRAVVQEEDENDDKIGDGNDEEAGSISRAAAEDEVATSIMIPAYVDGEPPALFRCSALFQNSKATDSADTAALPSDSTPDLLAPARQRLLDSLGLAGPEASSPEKANTNLNNIDANRQTAEFPKHHQSERKKETEVRDCDNDEEESGLGIAATLDMIITVVGEIYGQKDLLNARLLWDEMQ